MQNGIHRLLIRAPNWLGDVVMALPAIGAIRQSMRNAELTIAAIPSIAPMFLEETNAQPNGVLVIENVKEEPSILRRAGADAIVLLPNSFRSAWAARRAGIRERWGYSSGVRRPLLTRALSRPREKSNQSEYYQRLIEELGFTAAVGAPRVSVVETTRARAQKVLEEHRLAAAALVGFAPGAAYGHAKRWPPSRVAEVIARLARERGVASILFGATGDRSAGREIESSLPSGVEILNLIGRTDLRLFAGLVARCAGFVSNDSGSMHLAAALGVPLVAVFGPTDERATAPIGGLAASGQRSEPLVLTHPVFCRPCMLRECPIDHRCMKRITVDEVFGALTRQMDVAAAPGHQA